MISKLRFQIALGLLTLAVSLAVAQPGEGAAYPRPNIVFIFSDDHASQAISAYGSKVNETPAIDRLAREGMLFRQCLVTNSICGPSRACILTGKYSHLNGFYRNSNRFDGSQQTFPKILQEAGYETAIVGKWHLGSDPTGFDSWKILPGQGRYYNPEFIENGEKTTRPGYVTDVITELSLDWLENERDTSKPFLLMVQHKAPHRSWEPAIRHLGMFSERQIPEPSTLFDDYAHRGSAAKTQDMTIARTLNEQDLKLIVPQRLDEEQRKLWTAHYEPANEKFRAANLTGEELVRWKYQRYMQDYLACVAGVDESVGQILDYLDEAGLTENTIVVYSSDQGFFLGEHGWFDKRWIYEESLRTPLIVRWPGIVAAGSESDQLVSNLDFAETFLEFARVVPPDDMQGESLVPLLRGLSPSHWRDSFYYHYYEFPGPHSVAKHYGVRTPKFTLAHFYELDEWELYDLERDPQQMRNVFDDPQYAETVRELKDELTRLRSELQVPAKDPPL